MRPEAFDNLNELKQKAEASAEAETNLVPTRDALNNIRNHSLETRELSLELTETFNNAFIGAVSNYIDSETWRKCLLTARNYVRRHVVEDLRELLNCR